MKVDLHERRVKQVDTFKYLGWTVGESANSEKEIIKRISMAKAAFAKPKSVLSNLSIGTRVRILTAQRHLYTFGRRRGTRHKSNLLASFIPHDEWLMKLARRSYL